MTLPEKLLSITAPELPTVCSYERKKKARTDSETLAKPRVTWLQHRQRHRARRGRRASVFSSLHSTSPAPPHAQFLFNWKPFTPARWVHFPLTFSSAYFYPLFLPFLVLTVATRGKKKQKTKHVFSFSACNDWDLWMLSVLSLRRHPLTDIPPCLRTLLIFFSPSSPSLFLFSQPPHHHHLRGSFFTSSLVIIPETFCSFPGFFPLLLCHGLFWCGFGAFLSSCSVSLVLESERLSGRKHYSFDFHPWGFCFSNRWGIWTLLEFVLAPSLHFLSRSLCEQNGNFLPSKLNFSDRAGCTLNPQIVLGSLNVSYLSLKRNRITIWHHWIHFSP